MLRPSTSSRRHWADSAVGRQEAGEGEPHSLLERGIGDALAHLSRTGRLVGAVAELRNPAHGTVRLPWLAPGLQHGACCASRRLRLMNSVPKARSAAC